MSKQQQSASVDPLSKHVSVLTDLSSGLIAMAEVTPKGMTLAQSVFFLLAATADLNGRPTTFTEIRETCGDVINRSLHTTYRALLEDNGRGKETNRRPGLGWLTRRPNPLDEREKFLHLTPKGREVIKTVLEGLTGKEF